MDTKILHFIVCSPSTLDAVYEEHRWQIALLGKTLLALTVPESEVTELIELDWSYAADRVARERIRHGRPVHSQNVLLEVFTAYTNVGYDILQIERSLAQTLEKVGVEPTVVVSLRTSNNFVYMLADRLALELEKMVTKRDF